MSKVRVLAMRPRFCDVLCLVLVLSASPGSAYAAGISWRNDLPEAARESARVQKPLLILVDARWCGACHKMLQQTFPNASVAARVGRDFVPVRLDADQQSDAVESLKVDALPTLLVVSPGGKVLGRITGFQSAAQLDARLASFQPVQARARLATRGAPMRRSVAPSPPVPMPPPERSAVVPLSTLEAARQFSGG